MKILKNIKEAFSPTNVQGINADEIEAALNDAQVRSIWVQSVFSELQRMNMEVDKRLLLGTDYELTDLCARRKGIQDVFELILAAKRAVKRDVRPNPQIQVSTVDLDRVTA